MWGLSQFSMSLVAVVYQVRDPAYHITSNSHHDLTDCKNKKGINTYMKSAKHSALACHFYLCGKNKTGIYQSPSPPKKKTSPLVFQPASQMREACCSVDINEHMFKGRHNRCGMKRACALDPAKTRGYIYKMILATILQRWRGGGLQVHSYFYTN